MRWIGPVSPRFALMAIVVVALVLAPIVWLAAHPCVRYGAPHECTGMYCAVYNTDGTCMAWMPYTYECRECLVRR